MGSVFARRTDYAIRAAIEIARSQGRIKRHAIAEAIDAPTTVVAQSLADLVRGGVVHALAGPAGGYTLVRPAAEITVADVIRAVEPPGTSRCVLEERDCGVGGRCALCGSIDDAREAFIGRLERDTLASLANGEPTTPSAVAGFGSWLD